MKSRIFSILLIFSLLLSLFSNVTPVRAEDPFPMPDADGDSLLNEMETSGWYNLSGGPYVTDPRDMDSDNDGLTDGEEKLFDTNPLDAHSPGLAVKYDSSFSTKQYFSTTDPAYISMKEGGDQFLLTEALVVRRGNTFVITGPASGTLTITGTSMTTLTPQFDRARGGWSVSLTTGGTVGTYTATITDGSWTKSLPIYVIFELPTNLPQDQINAFLYDGDPTNKKDEVAVFWRMGEWPYYEYPNTNVPLCPEADPTKPCSLWQYHLAYGYAQAFWTEQFTKSVLVDHAIKSIHGKTTQAAAVPALATWTDNEFRSRNSRMQNNWTSSMYRWFDGTGITMSGGYCETTSTVYTTMLRSAGIAARPFAMDYNKTAGHGDSGQVGTVYEYDHATMMWLDGTWKAQRAYNGDEVKDLYYPWNSGTSGLTLLKNWATYSGYHNDKYGDGEFSVNAGWDFQTADGVGTVNTAWSNGVPASEFKAVNRDYIWDSKKPLEITQSPNVDVLNCVFYKGDNWAPSEWRDPVVSNPTGRDETLTYILPSGVPDPANPLENWPYNPKITACSTATSTAACNALKSSWVAVCTPIPEAAPAAPAAPNIQVQGTQSAQGTTEFRPNQPGQPQSKSVITLGRILVDGRRDLDGDGFYDELAVDFEVTSTKAGEYQFGGLLAAGDKSFRSLPAKITLKAGKQNIQITFDGQSIADNEVDGPYQLKALWATNPEQSTVGVIDPTNTLAYKEYSYSTKAYKANQFEILAAVFADEGFTHQGVDADGNGLYESLLVNIPLEIAIPGDFTAEGDLYDSQGDFVGHAAWTGSTPSAVLQFNVDGKSLPFTVEHLNLTTSNGELLDSRFTAVHEISDLAGMIEGSSVKIGGRDTTETGILSVKPGTYSILPVDTNSNALFDKLVVNVGVTVTDHGGSYRIEGLLEDSNGTEVAWSVSEPKTLVVGSQTMTLEFSGKELYDQLPLSGTKSFKLVAVKIYSGNLSTATLESEAKVATTTPAYSRSQFESSSPAVSLFQDDLENGTGKWVFSQPMWSLSNTVWQSWSHGWVAKASNSSNGQLTFASPLDLTDYAAPVLRFQNAYWMASTSNQGILEVSTDGATWTPVKTYTGSTPHWTIEEVDLSAYGETANVKLRFNAQSSNGLLWYVDDVYINAWPAVKTASFTYMTPVSAQANTTLTAAYTSINTSLPITYKWNFCGIERQTTSPDITYIFPDAGNCAVTLTVQNPYDSAVTSQTISVGPAAVHYSLSVNISPSSGGTVTKNPDKPAYNPGEIVTLTATPALGYTWANWTGACTGSGACTVTMDGNKSVTANFTSIEYTLGISTTGNGSVTRSPDQATYHYGDIVQLTAVPASHWRFSGWSGDLTGSINPTSVTINGNKVITATFVESDFTLTIGKTGQGTVVVNPDLAFYPVNQSVSLTANPASGWHFSSWSGDLTGSVNPASITMDRSKNITAAFTQDQYTLSTSVVGDGTVAKSPNLATYLYGDVVTVTATPAVGWSLSAWSGACTGSGACVVTMDGNKSVTATFTQDQYHLTVGVVGNGTVSKSPNQTTYTYGQAVTLAPTPALGWSFSEWSGACTGNGACAVTMNGDKNVTATFTQIEYTLTTNTVGLGTISRDPNQATYHYGDVVQLSAVPDGGWRFNSWSGSLAGTSNPALITIDGNKSVTATFAEDFFLLTIIIDGGGHVDLTPPGPYYAYHEMPQMLAVPNTGWLFSNWTGDRTGTANPMAITMSADKTVTAHFTAIPYTFTTNVIGQGTVNKSPEKTTYTYGDVVTITATAAPGWRFFEWNGACTGSGTCTVTVDGNESVTATFLENTFTLDVSVLGNGTVIKTPDQASYISGTHVTLTASPAAGWTFTGWSGDGCTGVAPCVVTITQNTTITAIFTQGESSLFVGISPADSGNTVTPSNPGPYNYNDVVVLTPSLAPGWVFDHWDGDLQGTSNPGQITITGSMVVTAYFRQIEYSLLLAASPVQGGTVTADKPAPYHLNDTLTLTPYPAAGYVFSLWEGACTGSDGCTVTILNNTSVTAVFTPIEYTLNISITGSGSVTPNSPGPYYYGNQVVLTAAPVSGWMVSGWSVAGCSGNTCTLTILSNTNVSVTFTQIFEYTLTTDVDGNGTITRNPDLAKYTQGTVVTLTANPDPGWSISSWTGDCTGTGTTCALTMNGDKSVTAHFVKNTLTLPQNLIVSAGTTRENFESLNGWTVSGTGTGYSAVVDPVNFKVGNASIKMTTPTTTGNVAITKTVNWDMSAPAEQGNIRFWVYVYGTGEPTDLQILMANDANFANYFTSYYNTSFKFTYRPGWNLINMRTSDWRVGAGAPSWTSPIGRIRIRFYGNSSASYSVDGLTSGVTASPVVLFAFEDADVSLWSQAYTYMNSRNVRGTGYIVTDWVNGTNKVTWAQLQDMGIAGWTIGNQTNANSDLTLLSLADQQAALLNAQTALSDHALSNSSHVAYPLGKYNANTLTAMANLGMRSGLTSLTFNNLSPLLHPFEIAQRSIVRGTALSTTQSWVNTAISRQEILVFTFHDISASPTTSGWYIDRFQGLVNYCISQGIPIITMEDLYQLQSGSISIPVAE